MDGRTDVQTTHVKIMITTVCRPCESIPYLSRFLHANTFRFIGAIQLATEFDGFDATGWLQDAFGDILGLQVATDPGHFVACDLVIVDKVVVHVVVAVTFFLVDFLTMRNVFLYNGGKRNRITNWNQKNKLFYKVIL